MNILRIITSMDPSTGGPCQGIRNSIPELEKLNINNEVVCLDDPSSSFLINDPFPINALGAGRGRWRYHPKLLPWLKKNIYRFDAIIVHGLWLYPSYAITKVIALFKKQQNSKENQVAHVPKIFIMPHGMLDPYFQEDSGRKLKAIRNWWYWKLIERKVINSAEGLLFTCEEELRLARKSFSPYNPRKEINVGYGIKRPPTYSVQMKNAFLNASPELGDSSYFLFLSRIHEKKGVDILIKAYGIHFKKIQWEGKRPPKLIIAGPGIDTSYGLKLRNMISEYPGLAENILFPGLLLGDEKWGAYYGCEAFILPSHQENFGIVVIESLACSRPVLISDKVNIWLEIENAGAGIVKNDSVDGVIQLFERWEQITDGEKKLMHLNARSLFEKKYTSMGAASALLKAISE